MNIKSMLNELIEEKGFDPDGDCWGDVVTVRDIESLITSLDGMSLVKTEPDSQLKADMMGEFSLSVPFGCEFCDNGVTEENEVCTMCDSLGNYMRSFNIPWIVIKDIYKAMINTTRDKDQ